MLTFEEMKGKAKFFRKQLLEMTISAQRGHMASCYSQMEILMALFYGGVFDRSKDKLFISKGHATMGLYPILADLGLIEKEELTKFCKKEGKLRLYADPSIPGIEFIAGSLGHGIGVACGHALAKKMRHEEGTCFVIVGDGELYEGSVWESLLFMNHHRLNMKVIIDRNNLCIMDKTEACIELEYLQERLSPFACGCYLVDGHNIEQLICFLRGSTQPEIIIAETVKGKGVSFMEGRPEWHNKMLNPEQEIQARIELT